MTLRVFSIDNLPALKVIARCARCLKEIESKRLICIDMDGECCCNLCDGCDTTMQVPICTSCDRYRFRCKNVIYGCGKFFQDENSPRYIEHLKECKYTEKNGHKCIIKPGELFECKYKFLGLNQCSGITNCGDLREHEKKFAELHLSELNRYYLNKCSTLINEIGTLKCKVESLEKETKKSRKRSSAVLDDLALSVDLKTRRLVRI